jgi:catechol 2,3-dioxygenase-like lactoylglutathione lyase family enzyme
VRSFCFALCLAISVAAPGQAAESGNQPPFRSISGAFFALSVADISASADWYSAKLGLRPVMVTPKRDRIAVTVLEGGGLIVELIQHDNAAALKKAAPGVSEPQMIHGLFKVGLVVENFEQTLAQLKARGAEIAYGPFPAREGQMKNVIIRDNSGNLIQFFGK